MCFVQTERFRRLVQNLDSPAGSDVIDAGGQYVMPGGIDPHTHMQLPVYGDRCQRGFLFRNRRGSRRWNHDDYRLRDSRRRSKTILELTSSGANGLRNRFPITSFHVAITWWDETVLPDMETLVREHGVNSFKHFMAYKGAIMADDEILVNSFSKALELGAITRCMRKTASWSIGCSRNSTMQGIRGPEGHPLSRPPQCEGEAANRAIRIAEVLGVPLYVVHVSARQSLEAIVRARNEGQRVFGEVLAGHLLVDDSVYRDPDFERAAAHVMSPPFRAKEHQEALWRGLQAGNLQTTATDHCCFCADQKAAGKEIFD